MCQPNLKFERKCKITFPISNCGFANLPEETFREIIQDGRVASPLSESLITHNFPSLIKEKTKQGKPKQTKGYDLLDSDSGYRKVEIKGLTKNGCSVRPSDQKGKGRAKDDEKFKTISDNVDYIIVDIRDPYLWHMMRIEGKELLLHFPSGEIKVDQANYLFNICQKHLVLNLTNPNMI